MRTLLRMACFAALASFLGSTAFALNVTDQVRINEVSYDPSETPEEPFEFVELFNAGGSTVFLDGAVISDEGNNGTGEGTFQFPGTVGGTTIPLAAGAYLLIVVDATGTTLPADYEVFAGGTDTDAPAVPNLVKTAGAGADLQLGNAGDGVTLSTGVTTGSSIPCTEVVDGVSWETGGANEVYAMNSTVCADPASNPGYANTGTQIASLQRCPNGADTNNSTNDFSPLNRTPKAANTGCGAIPPIITNLHYTPCFVAANQTVQVIANVTDENNDITSVRVYFRLDTVVPFDSLNMTLSMTSTYTATLPGRPDQSHVQYYIAARDGAGNLVKSPSTAPSFLRSYRVGLQSIASLQTAAADSCASSTSVGKAVNVVGVVTHRAFEYSDNFFYIQQGVAPNSGIKVFTGVDSAFVPNMGDSVRVSGFIEEFRCQTEVSLFTDCGTVLGSGRRVRTRQLSSVSQIAQEQNESMLVTVQGPITAVTGFDTTGTCPECFLEFKVQDGGGTAWVGDDTFFPDGVGYTVVPTPGMTFDALTGIVALRFKSPADMVTILRLEPRRDNDVDRDYTDVGDDELDVVRAFHLSQNSPNPFNPATKIEFAIPAPGHAVLRIYDAQGKIVRTLVDREYLAPTRESVAWDGRNDSGRLVNSGVYFYKLVAGDYSASRKMLLLK